MQRVNTLELLLDKNDGELRCLLNNNTNLREEEVRRLLRAMFNLKRCREAITDGNIEPNELFWDSWDRHHHIHHSAGASPRAHRSTSRFQQHYRNANTHGNHALSTTTVNVVDVSIRDAAAAAATTLTVTPYATSNIVDVSIKDTTDSVGITGDRHNQLVSPEDTSVSTLTPSPSPPNSPSISLSSRNTKKGFPTTPPAKKRHQTLMSQQKDQYQQQFSPPAISTTHTNSMSNDHVSVFKCKSYDLNASNNCSNYSEQSSTSTIATSTTFAHFNGNGSMTMSPATTHSYLPTPRSRLHTEPNPENFNDIVEGTSNLTVPRSPCTPIVTRGMGHIIAHRFTKKFKVMSTCDLCNKQMFFGLKCKECKYRCHKDCESNVPPSCGLPPEFIDEFKKTLPSDVFLPNTSPSMGKTGNFLLSSGRRDRRKSQVCYTSQYANAPDSSSAGSSCNSSSPSSPALLTIPPQTPAASKYTQFHFPDVNNSHSHSHHNHHKMHASVNNADIVIEAVPATASTPTIVTTKPRNSITCDKTTSSMSRSSSARSQSHASNDLVETTRSNDSDKTVSLSGSISASTDSVRSDSTEERESSHWPRQNSLSLKEWDIPFGDLKLLEKIGRGRFGTVHRGQWHGDVAVKVLHEDYLDDERKLEAFKQEVATFKKTRHENLVLFMGFCMKPQAIVTSLCKGNTLYTHIHLRKDKFNLYRATLVAQQISQGMGYLHAKDIVHKDLKTKNIFLENGKVIITDYGVFSAIKLQYSKEGLCISNNWLCYLAPELIRGLRPIQPAHDELQFSKVSDIYAFGTVWYELLCGEFPFKRQPPEAIIFQVGRGIKQTLANIQATRDVKDILMLCWAFQAVDRPDFAKLLTLLERLPKKRLARSPSHPVQLSRSAESVF